MILAHNHPSGVAEPSQADELITTRLRDALALVDIRVLDHLIVAAEQVTSLSERGLVNQACFTPPGGPRTLFSAGGHQRLGRACVRVRRIALAVVFKSE